MSNVIPFQYEGKSIRTIIDNNGEPWFIGNEIAGALGYSDSNDAVRKHCKRLKLLRPGDLPVLEINPRGINIIPESDVYRLIMRSGLPTAEQFQDWVVEDVLPTIRKTGKYEAPKSDRPFHKPDKMTLAFVSREYKAAIQLAKSFGMNQNQAILSANKTIKGLCGVDCMSLVGVTHLDTGEHTQHYTASDIGKQFGISGRETNKFLEAVGFQEATRDYKDRLKWVVTEAGQKHAVIKDTGKKHGDGTPILQIFWKDSVIELIRAKIARNIQ